MTYSELKTLVESKGYEFFDKGNYNLNIVYIRTNQDFTDRYTDVLHIAYKEGGVEKIFIAPCSTKAGSHYVKNPITYLGIKGTAVLIPNQYKATWQFIDNNSWLGTPYLKQIKNVKVWRDGVIDEDIDKQNIQEGNFGINLHTAGDIKGIVYNWSAGCLVTPKVFWVQVLDLLRKSAKLYGNTFTATLIDKK